MLLSSSVAAGFLVQDLFFGQEETRRRRESWTRMASKRASLSETRQQEGGQRWRNLLSLVLFVLCSVACSASVWLLWGHQGCDSLERKMRFNNLQTEPKLVDRHLGKDQLQALSFLIASLDQGRFYECSNKSLAEGTISSCLLHALEELHPEPDRSQDQQHQVTINISFQDQCPVQIDHVIAKSSESKAKGKYVRENISQNTAPSITNSKLICVKDCETILFKRESLEIMQEYHQFIPRPLFDTLSLVVYGVVFSFGFSLGRFSRSSPPQFQHLKNFKAYTSKGSCKWSKKFLFLGVILGLSVAVWIFVSMNANITERRKDALVNMCDERARMLQDQFNVSMNHVHALAILVSTFHHEKQPSAIDQRTFAEFAERTAFERPLMSGVAYALRVLHREREEFEKKHGWRIKKMEKEDQSLVKDDYNTEKLDPSPIQDEYAPVIFSQETVSHIVSVDMMSGKEDRENILRARATGKGVLTSPFHLLKSNHLGVVLTFAVYSTKLPSNATTKERIESTVGYLGASFDVPSLVDKLLHQLASKHTIVVNLYDTTNISAPIRMYGPNVSSEGEMHSSNVDFGDPTRKHEMHCRFKHKAPLPWSAITMSLGIAVIVLLVGHIFHAALNRIEKVEDDYREMRELKVRAEAADVAKSQFLATVSHEIRTPMNGVLGMLRMLMDTDLDATQQDFAMIAQSSGKSLITVINGVLDQAKIESGRLELESVPFNLCDVLDNVLSLFSDKMQEKGIELAVYVSDQVPEILIGDPGRFRQIITNLVGNSVKFTHEGHILVTVHLVEEVQEKNHDVLEDKKDVLHETLSGFEVVEKRKIWEKFNVLKTLTNANETINLMVTVEDTGIGIPQDAQVRIFTPFMQADSSTSRTYGGTGIGLSISKCLVEKMGGEIGFVSKSGTGSTFSFTAVFKKEDTNASDTKNHHSDPSLLDFHGLRGLVADGRRTRAEITKYHLQRLGIHVEVETTKESATDAVLDACSTSGREHFDIILVDKDAWGEGTGISFPTFLFAHRQNGTIILRERLPKIFLIATSLSPAESQDLKSAGFVDQILKPLRLSMIAACFRKALGVEHNRKQPKGHTMSPLSLLVGKNILVVDDNVVNRKIASATLKKFGAIATCVESGQVAIKMLNPPHHFDACLMDVQMPEMDGFQTTLQIRLLENKVNGLIRTGEASSKAYGDVTHWHVPILAMTADVIQATYEECLRCGMDDYVSKPFEEQQLYSAIARFFKPNGDENSAEDKCL